MMRYDFETIVDRRDAGSVKWDMMLDGRPDLPAGVVPLSIGDMELKNPPEIVEGLKACLDRDILGYTHPTAAYWEAVQGWFAARHGWEIDAEWVVPMDGVVPAMFAAVRAFSEPGDGVVVMPPVYYPFFRAAGIAGRRVIEAPLVESASGYVMDFAALETAVRDPKTKLLLLCSPHNPVCRVWRREELERLGRLCLANDVLVVSDEIHMDFVLPGSRHVPYALLGEEYSANAIVCTSPSKSFNVAGLQLANIVIPNARLRRRFRREYDDSGRHGPNQLGLAACRLAYGRCGGWFDRLLELIAANAEAVRRFMAGHFPEVRVCANEGTYFLWLDFRKWGMSVEELERFMTERARLFLDEGHIFGTGGAGFERFNLACPTRVLEEALGRLAAARISGA